MITLSATVGLFAWILLFDLVAVEGPEQPSDWGRHLRQSSLAHRIECTLLHPGTAGLHVARHFGGCRPQLVDATVGLASRRRPTTPAFHRDGWLHAKFTAATT